MISKQKYAQKVSTFTTPLKKPDCGPKMESTEHSDNRVHTCCTTPGSWGMFKDASNSMVSRSTCQINYHIKKQISTQLFYPQLGLLCTFMDILYWITKRLLRFSNSMFMALSLKKCSKCHVNTNFHLGHLWLLQTNSQCQSHLYQNHNNNSRICLVAVEFTSITSVLMADSSGTKSMRLSRSSS